MNLSLNEVEATAKKAARGATYPWGLAEEAGKATRWLCSHDIDGCRALIDLLGRIDGTDILGWLPRITDGIWAARDGMLCPLATGAAISDGAAEVAAKGIRTGAIAAPMLLAPFAALLAREFGKPLTISIGDVALCTDAERLSASGEIPAWSSEVRIRVGGSVDQSRRIVTRANPAPADWDALLSLAHRTYAPATDDSRLRGAGAGLSDND